MQSLIVGLGNPGKKYEKTRHNVGFVVLDKLAQELGIKNYKSSKKYKSLITNNKSLILAKPQTSMNNSGIAVKKLTDHYLLTCLPARQATNHLYIIHDDLDIPLGQFKIQKGIGPKDHKGLLSIEESLSTKDFWRVRIGVDNRDPSNRIEGEEYVLQNFTKEEKEVLETTIKKLLTSIIKR